MMTFLKDLFKLYIGAYLGMILFVILFLIGFVFWMWWTVGDII
tara:strand:+ start:462 stop:590 length:129 start_codon:yes stop_codon:yes gene_type:complete